MVGLFCAKINNYQNFVDKLATLTFKISVYLLDKKNLTDPNH